jgi:peroxiredoxin Q/BCP
MLRFLVMMVLSLVAGSTENAWAIAVGDSVPEFSVKTQDGAVVNRANISGKPVLFYFYPKDETPGCTKQACSLRDEFAEFKKLGAVVYGVSRQDAESHQAFRAKHKLPFDLLVDADGSLADKLGVEKMPIVGFHKRQSVWVTPAGKVFRIHRDVDPATHTATALADLKEMLKSETK